MRTENIWAFGRPSRASVNALQKYKHQTSVEKYSGCGQPDLAPTVPTGSQAKAQQFPREVSGGTVQGGHSTPVSCPGTPRTREAEMHVVVIKGIGTALGRVRRASSMLPPPLSLPVTSSLVSPWFVGLSLSPL